MSRAIQHAIMELGPALYWPLDDLAGPIAVDHSGHERHGTIHGGVLARQIGLSGGGRAVSLDGEDDRVVSDYATRRNHVKNPRFDTGLDFWQGYADGEIARYGNDTDFLLGNSFTCTVTVPAGGTGGGGMTSGSGPAASAGETWTASIHARGGLPSGALEDVRLVVAERDATNALIVSESINFTTKNDWERIHLTRTLTNPNTTSVTFSVITQQPEPTARFFYLKGAMLEKTSVLPPYFDGQGYVNWVWVNDSGGHVGWAGTPNASPSEKGPFADGTFRTYMGFAERENQGAIHTLFGTPNLAASPTLRVEANSRNVHFDMQADSGDTVVWENAWPAAKTPAHWALLSNRQENFALLVVNGTVYLASTTDNFNTAQPLQIGALGTMTYPFRGKMAHFAMVEGELDLPDVHSVYRTGIRGHGGPFR